MPFTFSHPSIVLPFHKVYKKWTSLTGLIIGSIIPDFEYFLRFKIKSIHSHSIWGIFYFDLPFGLLMAIIFHSIVKQPLINNLPLFLKERFIELDTHWINYFKKNWIIVCFSIIIGAFSHILWDSFSHYNGFFVELFPTLKNTILGIPIFKFLQHGSTIIGAIIIAYYIYELPKRETINTLSHKYWATTFTLALVFICLRLFIENVKSGHLIVSIISSFMLSLFITSIFFKSKT